MVARHGGIVEADAEWFATHPGQTHRCREADLVEAVQFHAAGVTVPPATEGCHWELMVEVEEFVPGFRARRPYWALICGGDDVTTSEAA